MRHRWNELTADLPIMWDGAGFQVYNPFSRTRIPLPVMRAWVFVRDVARCLWCVVFGHALVETSFATPEHGNIAHECTRCGWSRELWLY